MLVRTVLIAIACAAPVAAAPIDDAVALAKAGRYPEAEKALTALAVDDPSNAEVAYQLGEVMNAQHKYDHGLSWLERAVALAPGNERYLCDYAGSALEEADRHSSYSLAVKGRDAMIHAIELDPKDLDARYGLLQFYAKAPWPLGDTDKAWEQAHAIRKQDPVRGLAAEAFIAIEAKNYAAAIDACKEALKRDPNAFDPLYQLGRAAAFSGTELDLGIACLRKCLQLPATDDDATPTALYYRLGSLLQKKGDIAGARAAFLAALKADSSNKAAFRALDKLPRVPTP